MAAATGSTVRVAKEDVSSGHRGSGELCVALEPQRLRLSAGPLRDPCLCVGIRRWVTFPVSHQDHLVEDLPLQLGEGPAAYPPVVGREVAGRDGQSLPGDDEYQQTLLRQVSGGVDEEGMLRPFVFRVPIVGRVEVEDTEGAVGYGGAEQVRGEGTVQPPGRFFGPFAVQLHPVGLHGDSVGLL